MRNKFKRTLCKQKQMDRRYNVSWLREKYLAVIVNECRGKQHESEQREIYTKISFGAEFPMPSIVCSVNIYGVNEYIIMELINYRRPEATKDRTNIIKTTYKKKIPFTAALEECKAEEHLTYTCVCWCICLYTYT